MKRITINALLLVGLAGCSATQSAPDIGPKTVYDYRRPGAQATQTAAAPWQSNPSTASPTSNNGVAASPLRIPGAPSATVARTDSSSTLVAQADKRADMLPPLIPPGSTTTAMKPSLPKPEFPEITTPARDLTLSDGDSTSKGSKTKSASSERTETKGMDKLIVASGEFPAARSELPDRHPAGPSVRMVNSKQIKLDYKISDVGPSGISTVELWCTRDGNSWKKYDVGAQSHPPCEVTVPGEGVYGFTMVARNGIGLGKTAPRAGDMPQVWVGVDLTNPAVSLAGVEPGFETKAQNVLIRWTAKDENFGPRPISISYAEQAKGPWQPIASNLANSGRYVWQVPASVPARFHVRVEATDLAGNVGYAETREPVVIDLSQPNISILAVETTGAK